MRGLMSSVILNERIITTEAKGKNVQPQVEKIITIAREDTEAHRRLVMSKLANPLATLKLFEEIGPAIRGAAGWVHAVVPSRSAPGRWRADGRVCG